MPANSKIQLPLSTRLRLIRRHGEHWGRNALMKVLCWFLSGNGGRGKDDGKQMTHDRRETEGDVFDPQKLREGRVQRVLVVRTGKALGDALISLVLVSELKRLFPGIKVDFLLRDNIFPLFRGVSEINSLLEWRPRVWTSPLAALHLFRALRKNRYDAAIVSDNPFKTSFTTLCLALWTGAPYRVGFDNEESRPFLNLPVAPLKEVHMALNLQRLLSPLGWTSSLEKQSLPRFTPSPHAMREADRLLDGETKKPVIIFASGHWRKSWPLPFFVGIAKELTARKFPVLLAFGPGDSRLNDPLAKEWMAGSGGFGKILPPQSLEIFAAISQHSRLFMATDCGPYHLAVAVGAPCVGIFRTREAQRDFGYEEPPHLTTVYHPEEKEAGQMALDSAMTLLDRDSHGSTKIS